MASCNRPKLDILPQEKRLLEALDILIAAALDATAPQEQNEQTCDVNSDEKE